MGYFYYVSGVIGIVGFILSFINFLYSFIMRRKKVNVRFEKMGITPYYEGKEVLKIKYSFENNSQLPISITRIRLIINEKYYDCTDLPVVIEEVTRKRKNEIYDCDITKSNSTPINLLPLASDSGYFAFPIPKGILSNDEKALTFQICTSRGKAVQKTFVLYEDVLIR